MDKPEGEKKMRRGRKVWYRRESMQGKDEAAKTVKKKANKQRIEWWEGVLT